ncbi:MAG: 30S ribosomal protein S8e [Candidatus Micrarchaeota archaeon]
MTQYHKQPKTKCHGTGGKRRATRDKILLHYGGFFSRTKLEKDGKEKRETLRSKGGSTKLKGKKISFIVVSAGATSKKVKITNVVESPDNRHYARENIITHGAIVETELGKCRVTSRPGQDGVVNAVLLQEKPAAKP